MSGSILRGVWWTLFDRKDVMRLFASLPLLALLAPLTGCGASGPIALNEFVASNVSGLTDDAGGTPDWVELINKNATDVSLDGWFLSDDGANPERHPLDGLTVPGGGFLLLFASGDTALGDDHLSFRLSAAGEDLLLSNGQGVVDSITYAAQDSDVASARVPDATGDWRAATPTPGESNE